MTGEWTRTRGLNAYMASPVAGPRRSGMLVLPMVTGIGAQVREYAHGMASAGVTAVVWDPFEGRSSDNSSGEELLSLMGQLDDAAVCAEQVRLLDHMFEDLGLAQVGVLGWCMGGRFALLLAAQDGRLANCVAYHPTVPEEPWANHTEDPVARCAQIAAPVQLIYPGADHLVSHTVFRALQERLQQRSAAATHVSVYPEAEHGFMDAWKRGSVVNLAATRQSWATAMAFIQATLD
ncbi:dienelactone hydrolase family protein [Lipingzhangella sp. LS1_29]|uniref:Dienelactone hydrolase family protein n=1 Tax=Lipingzhangella rawalii TaxID=2055835 RepID=A0ABU2H2R9_9ACTN|nr:dienelactone hydrolase family protein [Lipingzhangella rawalii]MDS1269282.1 dienelactone hydrolase family protein [Lipingzhangella rawalii]